MAQGFDVTQSLFGSVLTPQQQADSSALAQANLGGLGMAQFQAARSQEMARQQIPKAFGQQSEDDIVQDVRNKNLPILQSQGKIAYLDAIIADFSARGMGNKAFLAQQLKDQVAQKEAESRANVSFKEAQAEQMRAKATAGPKDDRSPEKKKMDELIAQGVPTAEARSIAYKTQSVDFRRELAEEKRADKERSMLEKQQSTITTIDGVINKVDEATKQVSPWSAGKGSIFSVIPGSDAKNLAATVETIKANLGFDRLQRMRDASPTGGALGQVAVQELVALQSSVASLDIAQSPEQLKKNLDAVKRHYQNWRNAILESQKQQPAAQAGEVQRPSTATPPIAPQQQQGRKPVVRFVRDAQGNIVRQ